MLLKLDTALELNENFEEILQNALEVFAKLISFHFLQNFLPEEFMNKVFT